MNITRHFLAILDEAFDRPPTSWAHFTDGDGPTSYFGTLAQVNVDQATQVYGGTSIAAQTKHVIFVLDVAAKALRGEAASPDAEQWQQSWRLNDLDSVAWDQMRDDLRNAYSSLRQAICDVDFADEDSFAIGVGVTAHIAYHLGEIRCKFGLISHSEPKGIGNCHDAH